MKKLPKKFVELCKSVSAKRPKTVIDHILKNGFITTQELKEKYGYNHPPRAVRDVREHGIPIETFRVTGTDGRKIAAYRFGDPRKSRFKKLSGRTGLSKKLKEKLIAEYGCKCFIYLEYMDEKDLQIDHRIPFEVGGDDNKKKTLDHNDFMLLSGSANRAKSWSCENCYNWNNLKDRKICVSCYWAYPEKYDHIAMKPIRRVDLIWQGEDIKKYEKLCKAASEFEKEIPEFIKELIDKQLNDKK